MSIRKSFCTVVLLLLFCFTCQTACVYLCVDYDVASHQINKLEDQEMQGCFNTLVEYSWPMAMYPSGDYDSGPIVSNVKITKKYEGNGRVSKIVEETRIKKVNCTLDRAQVKKKEGEDDDELNTYMRRSKISEQDAKELLGNKPRAEEFFIRKKLVQVGRNVNIIWLPTTLWDVFTVATAMTDPFFRKKITKYKFKSKARLSKPLRLRAGSSNKKVLKAKLKFYRNVADMMVDYITRHVQLHPLMRPCADPEDSLSVYKWMLEDLLSMPRSAGGEELFGPLLERFREEAKALRSTKKSSVLFAAVSAEVTAVYINAATMFTSNFATPTDDGGAGDVDDDFMDFPMKLRKNAVEEFSEQCRDKSKPIPVVSIPFAFSMLSNAIFDSAEQQGNCPLSKSSNNYFYGIMVGKGWALSKGSKVFYIPRILLHESVVGSSSKYQPASKRTPDPRSKSKDGAEGDEGEMDNDTESAEEEEAEEEEEENEEVEEKEEEEPEGANDGDGEGEKREKPQRIVTKEKRDKYLQLEKPTYSDTWELVSELGTILSNHQRLFVVKDHMAKEEAVDMESVLKNFRSGCEESKN